MELKINKKFKDLAPPLSAEEYQQLEENILAEGCRDALVVWSKLIDRETGFCKGQNCYKEVELECGDGIWKCVECGYGVLPWEYDTFIVDGHNRYEICQRHGLDFRTVEREFDDEEAAADWIDANQLGRRNLSPDQLRLIRGRRYSRLKMPWGGNRDTQKNATHRSSGMGDTAQYLGKEYGVHEETIRSDGKLYEQVEALREKYPEEIEKIYSGEARANPVLKEIYQADKKAVVGKRDWTDSEAERRELVKQGETVVCSIYTDMKLVEWAKDNDLYVRIDRCTEWGNPFEIPGDGDRQEVCKSYKIYYGLKKSLHGKVGTLKGKVLGCHCYPEECHGDFLKGVADNED